MLSTLFVKHFLFTDIREGESVELFVIWLPTAEPVSSKVLTDPYCLPLSQLTQCWLPCPVDISEHGLVLCTSVHLSV